MAAEAAQKRSDQMLSLEDLRKIAHTCGHFVSMAVENMCATLHSHRQSNRGEGVAAESRAFVFGDLKGDRQYYATEHVTPNTEAASNIAHKSSTDDEPVARQKGKYHKNDGMMEHTSTNYATFLAEHAVQHFGKKSAEKTTKDIHDKMQLLTGGRDQMTNEEAPASLVVLMQGIGLNIIVSVMGRWLNTNGSLIDGDQDSVFVVPLAHLAIPDDNVTHVSLDWVGTVCCMLDTNIAALGLAYTTPKQKLPHVLPAYSTPSKPKTQSETSDSSKSGDDDTPRSAATVAKRPPRRQLHLMLAVKALDRNVLWGCHCLAM